MSSVLRELEELRTMLESPKKTYTAFRPLTDVGVSTPRQQKTYSSPAPNTAEKSVDRLGHAIQAAEEEMEAALRRTNDVHRNQLKQKELENMDLQHVIAAKERSIDSMRDTLSTTRRAYEGKQMQLESTLESRDAEISVLREELRSTQAEFEQTKKQLSKRLSELAHVNDELEHHGEDLRRGFLAKSEEAAHTLANLREERETNRIVQLEGDEMRRRLGMLEGDLLLLRRESQAVKDRLELELDDANKRYRSEKSIRKACEKWLKAELKSRDEYDMLLTAIRDTASGGISEGKYFPPSRLAPPPSARDLLEVERMVHEMQTQSQSPGRRATRERTASPGRLVSETSLAEAAKLSEDNRRLKGELMEAKRLIQDRLAR